MSKPDEGIQLTLMVEGIDTKSIYVRSPDVPGLHLIGRSYSAMKPMIAAAIERLYRDNLRKNVRVIFVSSPSNPTSSKPRSLEDRVVILPLAA